MQDLRISIIQTNLIWEDIDKNLQNFNKLIDSIEHYSDLIVLPEMFNTGFSINPKNCAEETNGKTYEWLKNKAKEKECVIIGSISTKENNKFYNRLVVMYPNGECDFYDKRHLFRLSDEFKIYSAGNKRLIVNINGWKILPLICYDLRFPVWSKNTFINNSIYEYDCLIYVANWPARRNFAWKSLLPARAIENQSYVIAANRIGLDGYNIPHSGDSAVFDFKGKTIISAIPDKEEIIYCSLAYSELNSFRKEFTIGYDWDKFEIKQ